MSYTGASWICQKCGRQGLTSVTYTDGLATCGYCVAGMQVAALTREAKWANEQAFKAEAQVAALTKERDHLDALLVEACKRQGVLARDVVRAEDRSRELEAQVAALTKELDEARIDRDHVMGRLESLEHFDVCPLAQGAVQDATASLRAEVEQLREAAARAVDVLEIVADGEGDRGGNAARSLHALEWLRAALAAGKEEP